MSKNDIYDNGYKALNIGKSYFKDSVPEKKVHKSQPSYQRKIPIGQDARTGKPVYMKLSNEDRILISGRTGSGKTDLSKTLLSRFYMGGINVLAATDVKNDYIDIDKQGGASKKLIDEHKAGVFETEEKKEKPQSSPKKTYIPLFLAEEHRDESDLEGIKKFAFDIQDLNESEFMSLLDVTSSTQQDVLKRCFRDENVSMNTLYDLVSEFSTETNSRRSLQGTVRSLQEEKVLSSKKKYHVNPIDAIKEGNVCTINFKKWQNFKRGSSRKKLELYCSIVLRKLREAIESGEIDGQTAVYIEEADVFAGDKAEISRKDIIELIDLGRAYYIPMLFSAQRPSQLDDDGNNILGQMNHFFLDSSINRKGYKRVLEIANIWRTNDAQREKWQDIFQRMSKYQWMYVNADKSTWKIIDNYSPLWSHTDDARKA